MFRTLTPLLALVVAVALYFTYIDPTMVAVRDLEEQTADYRDAVDKAEQLRARISELIAQRNSIPQGDLERLEAFLPDRIDEVELLIAIDALADGNGVQLSNIDVESGGSATISQLLGGGTVGRTQPAAATTAGYVPFDMSFQIAGTYDDVRGFINEIESSLQAIEIMTVDFSAAETPEDPLMVSMTIRAFSLAQTN